MNVLSNLALALMMLQYPRRVAPGRQDTNPQGAITDAVATFEGTFKFADKKYVTVEVEEGQTLRMFITGSTRFIRDGKPARTADFHTDDKVRVDASRDARLNLIAVRVEAVTPVKPTQ